MNNIYAIIVTYNPEIDLLLRQYESVIEQVNGIIYVDNGSSSNEELRNFHKSYTSSSNTEYIYNDKNIGLGAAQNQGIELSFKRDADHILLLDHDSVIEPNFINNLVSTERKLLANGIKVGLVGPIFFNPINNEQYPVIVVNGFLIKKIRPEKGMPLVSYTIASGSLIRKEVLENIGLMNEDLFVDFIDNEWCWRANYYGYKIAIATDAKMQHIIGDRRMTFLGQNLSSHSPLRRYYSCRNTLLTFRYKHFPLSCKIRALTIHLIKIFIIAIKVSNRKQYLKYSLIGIIDGIKGVKGPCSLMKNV